MAFEWHLLPSDATTQNMSIPVNKSMAHFLLTGDGDPQEQERAEAVTQQEWWA